MPNIRLAASNSEAGAGGPQGPEGPMLEARVANLERKIDRIENILEQLAPKITETLLVSAKQADLHDMRAELAEVRGRIYALPTWWVLLVTVLATWGAGAGIVYSIAKVSHG
jgi:hypothetical protein